MKADVSRIHPFLFHTPAERYRQIFHSVLSAGRCRLAADYQLASWMRPGHDLVLSLEGTGIVQLGKRTFSIGRGELGWINCYNPRIFWPRRTGPWDLLWVRVDSPQMNLIAAALDVERDAIFKLREPAGVLASYKTIFRLLHKRPMTLDAELHAAISSLIALLFKSRQVDASGEAREATAMRNRPDLAKLLEMLRREYERRWTINDLCRLSGLSVPQLFRQFGKATGSTPMDWLRRERINHAKRRLVETRERIGKIAAAVGYDDQLYFSRDFKKVVGVSPRNYRYQEQALMNLIRGRSSVNAS